MDGHSRSFGLPSQPQTPSFSLYAKSERQSDKKKRILISVVIVKKSCNKMEISKSKKRARLRWESGGVVKTLQIALKGSYTTLHFAPTSLCSYSTLHSITRYIVWALAVVQWPNCKIIRQGPSQAGAKQAAFKSRFILVIIATGHLNHCGFMQHNSNALRNGVKFVLCHF